MQAPSSTIAATPWHLPVLLKASAACHLGAGALALAQPSLWPWALGAVVADHALVAATGLWPRSTWLGGNLLRLPAASAARREVALTIDDGPDPEITPQVLDLLDAQQARATFFCIARHAEKHPALCREIVRRGHSVQNHSHRHSHRFSVMGPGAIRRELQQAQDTLAQVTGQLPRYFRAPAGLRNLFLDPLLHEFGLRLVAWTRRGFDTARSDPADVLQRLTRELAAGDILLLHDHNTATAASGRPVTLEVLPDLLRGFERSGLRGSDLAGGPRMKVSLGSRTDWPGLIDAACAHYRQAGRFARVFARCKLTLDPVFRHLMQSALIPPRARVLDIGCGQGLLASLLSSSDAIERQGRWPTEWGAAPASARVTGIDLMPREVDRAKTALGESAKFICGDMRRIPFPESDTVVILDVLHYVSEPDQNEVLARVRDSLPIGGKLLMRVGDAGARRGIAASRWVDRLVALGRRRHVVQQCCRPLAAWRQHLESLGFEVQSQPMSQGTPFANVLLVARRRAAA